MSEEGMRCIVSGRVQGVGFRAACQAMASALGLRGWVRNRADGTVEVYAVGSDKALKQLRGWLAQGPKLAHVEHVACEAAAAEPMRGFAVRY